MRNVDKLPRFMPGQVIDLSYKNKGLPNRIIIRIVFINEQSKGWLYEVQHENTGEISVLSQDFIAINMTKRELPVYKCTEIINLYNSGWRFCGNYSVEEAHKVSAKIATSKHIKNVIIRHALNHLGCLVNDKRSIWIKYCTTIRDDGTIVDNNAIDTDVIVVK